MALAGMYMTGTRVTGAVVCSGSVPSRIVGLSDGGLRPCDTNRGLFKASLATLIAQEGPSELIVWFEEQARQ